jgi:hypothetical protein
MPRDLDRQAFPPEERGVDIDRDAAELWNGWILRPRGDNNTVGLFDWLGNRGGGAAAAVEVSTTWHVTSALPLDELTERIVSQVGRLHQDQRLAVIRAM